jgi:hypothetical protein
MRATLPRLVRILKRSAIALPEHGHPPLRIYEEPPKDARREPTLLRNPKEKEGAGSNYPPNIRIEPVAAKKTFAGVKRDLVPQMKAILRER